MMKNIIYKSGQLYNFTAHFSCAFIMHEVFKKKGGRGTTHLKTVIKLGSTQSNISQITFLNIKKK